VNKYIYAVCCWFQVRYVFVIYSSELKLKNIFFIILIILNLIFIPIFITNTSNSKIYFNIYIYSYYFIYHDQNTSYIHSLSYHIYITHTTCYSISSWSSLSYHFRLWWKFYQIFMGIINFCWNGSTLSFRIQTKIIVHW
jgi:hypothetical protein